MTAAPWTLSHTNGDSSFTVEVTGRFVANNIGMLRQLALNGMGVVMTAESMVLSDVAEQKLVHMLPEWSPANVQVYALTTTRLLPTKVRVFIDYLVARLASPVKSNGGR